jgi:hypothetical protein
VNVAFSACCPRREEIDDRILERFSQLLTLCFSLLGKETDQATGPMIMKFALEIEDAIQRLIIDVAS